MVKIAGKYQLVKNENFLEYLKALGFPEEDAKKFDTVKSIVEVVVNGKQITLSSTSSMETSSPTFILDQEVDEATAIGTLKSTAKLTDDTLTISSKTTDGKIAGRIFKFTDNDLVLTLSSSDEKVPSAKRYYKKV